MRTGTREGEQLAKFCRGPLWITPVSFMKSRRGRDFIAQELSDFENLYSQSFFFNILKLELWLYLLLGFITF